MTLSILAEFSDTTNLSENLTDYFPYNAFVNHLEYKDFPVKSILLQLKKEAFFTFEKSFFQVWIKYSFDSPVTDQLYFFFKIICSTYPVPRSTPDTIKKKPII